LYLPEPLQLRQANLPDLLHLQCVVLHGSILHLGHNHGCKDNSSDEPTSLCLGKTRVNEQSASIGFAGITSPALMTAARASQAMENPGGPL
jgi:hypothetical protein